MLTRGSLEGDCPFREKGIFSIPTDSHAMQRAQMALELQASRVLAVSHGTDISLYTANSHEAHGVAGPQATLTGENVIRGVAWMPRDNGIMTSLDMKSFLSIWDMMRLKLVHRAAFKDATCHATSTIYTAVGHSTGATSIMDLRYGVACNVTGTPVQEGDPRITQVTWATNQDSFYTAHASGMINSWDVRNSAKPNKSLQIPGGSVIHSLNWTNESCSHLLTCDDEGFLTMASALSGNVIWRTELPFTTTEGFVLDCIGNVVALPGGESVCFVEADTGDIINERLVEGLIADSLLYNAKDSSIYALDQEQMRIHVLSFID